jgi:enoyl-CoA hydratase/carnithine racemase
MSVENVIESRMEGKVAVLSMVHRPYNLLGPTLAEALYKELQAAQVDGALAIVIRSGLRHFSAGADIKMFEESVQSGLKPTALDADTLVSTFENLSIPVVASVHGTCVGGGFELALLCDYVISASTAKIGSVEAMLGIHPLAGAVQRVTKRAGALRAKEMAMLARRYDPETLKRWNLVDRVVPEDQLDAKALEIAQELAKKPALAQLTTKRLAAMTTGQKIKATDDTTKDLEHVPNWNSRDISIGLDARNAIRTARVRSR